LNRLSRGGNESQGIATGLPVEGKNAAIPPVVGGNCHMSSTISDRDSTTVHHHSRAESLKFPATSKGRRGDRCPPVAGGRVEYDEAASGDKAELWKHIPPVVSGRMLTVRLLYRRVLSP